MVILILASMPIVLLHALTLVAAVAVAAATAAAAAAVVVAVVVVVVVVVGTGKARAPDTVISLDTVISFKYCDLFRIR